MNIDKERPKPRRSGRSIKQEEQYIEETEREIREIRGQRANTIMIDEECTYDDEIN